VQQHHEMPAQAGHPLLGNTAECAAGQVPSCTQFMTTSRRHNGLCAASHPGIPQHTN
jgi:hypothetical protein